MNRTKHWAWLNQEIPWHGTRSTCLSACVWIRRAMEKSTRELEGPGQQRTPLCAGPQSGNVGFARQIALTYLPPTPRFTSIVSLQICLYFILFPSPLSVIPLRLTHTLPNGRMALTVLMPLSPHSVRSALEHPSATNWYCTVLPISAINAIPVLSHFSSLHPSSLHPPLTP